MAHIMDLLRNHEPQIHYRMLRPMVTQHLSEHELELLLQHGSGISMDCSESTTLVCRLAGLASPSGPRYPYSSGLGNTDTMYAHLPHYGDPRRALTGALCIFGRYPGTDHVAIVRRPDAKHGDPTLWSHGQEHDPRELPFSALRDYFGTYTFCSIAHL
jgi:hypothetical protein